MKSVQRKTETRYSSGPPLACISILTVNGASSVLVMLQETILKAEAKPPKLTAFLCKWYANFGPAVDVATVAIEQMTPLSVIGAPVHVM